MVFWLYEPGGRRFESFRARHTKKKGSSKDGPFFVVRFGAGRFEAPTSDQRPVRQAPEARSVSAKRESILPGAPFQEPGLTGRVFHSAPVGFPALAGGFGRSTGTSSSGACTNTVSPFRARHTTKKGSSEDGPFFFGALSRCRRSISSENDL